MESQSRKRARPVVSCLRCREKKLKCDRVDPCENCIKAGHRADCAYNQHPTELASKTKRVQLSADASSNCEQLKGFGTGIIEDLQQRLTRVEALLASRSASEGVAIQSSWLVAVYTTNFEKTLRILHIPSFLRQYEHFWASPEDESYLSSPFIPQLTAVLAVSVIWGEASSKMENITSWEYLRLNAVSLLQVWLQKLPRKHRTELTTLQIETLILLARQLRLTSAEESWKAAGSLVRSAMVMGLHIDASTSTKLSVFQAEIRRRLWITIAEMDLQASITSGMPIMTPLVDFTRLSPANLNDVDFDESSTEIPAPEALETPTDTLALVILARTLSHRVSAMNFIQQSSPGMDLNERLQHGKTLEECLRDIPYPLKIDHTSNNDTMSPILLNQVLLDLYIRRPLLCLYRPVNTDNNQDHTSLQIIQRACLNSSLIILSYQDYFDPNLADLDAQNSHQYWDIFYTFCKNDILCAALGVCEYMRQKIPTTDQYSSNGSLDPNIENQPHSKASLTRLVENTLDSLSRRIGEAGNNVKDILLLAVVLQSVRGHGSPETKDRWLIQGAKKALSACRQYLLPAVTDQNSAFGYQTQESVGSSGNHLVSQFSHPPHIPQLQDLLQSSALAVDFANFHEFQEDLFSFDETFYWNS
ncbi:uncharacterized protein N7511_006744 [Penicillium nucicola]|uniref:uncharacterized protein n=1 Tax=Penicillium nucicola TaxID=1850975 RepID=UPI0025451973|nr:uncharacterized protein N7511_006744 [Penicillium nucicola]KAJ5758050.1 hypothetical protein N7511_006744 [Penicillium nucicola]